MLIADCKGCSYLHWAIGIGLGVRCTHPEHRIDAQPPMPLISAVTNCQFYKAQEADHKSKNSAEKGCRMKQDEKQGLSAHEQASKVSDEGAGNGPDCVVGKQLPAPALLAIEPLARLDQERVRAELSKNQVWLFNYSIIKLDAPDLAKILENWLQALEVTIFPLRIDSIELTFARPLAKGTPTVDGAEAFITFARTCSKLIERVAPEEPTTIHLFWSHRMPSMSDCLNDWRLDLDPIRVEANEAVEQLIRDLDCWLRGMHSFSINLHHQGVGAS